MRNFLYTRRIRYLWENQLTNQIDIYFTIPKDEWLAGQTGGETLLLDTKLVMNGIMTLAGLWGVLERVAPWQEEKWWLSRIAVNSRKFFIRSDWKFAYYCLRKDCQQIKKMNLCKGTNIHPHRGENHELLFK